LAVCLNFSTVINIKILKFTSHIASFFSVVLITEMLEICIQTSDDKNVQLILKSYLPVVYGTSLITHLVSSNFSYDWTLQEYYKASLCVRTNTTLSFVIRSDHTVIGPYKNIAKPHYVLELTPDSHLQYGQNISLLVFTRILQSLIMC
jgi:hypothetical protein